MKPNDKQLGDLRKKIAHRRTKIGLSNAEIGRLSDVHPSQVGRICAGNFKTISNNVVQICRVLRVRVPMISEGPGMNTEWALANASLRRIWDQTPEGAVIIRRVLDAIADLHVPGGRAQIANGSADDGEVELTS